eukprot:scaffold27493_cov76-Skeletonema_dohrnii-CCMP3373.AAC.1
MDGSVEKNVNRLRITSYNPLVTTARRTNGTDVACPSIPAGSYKPQPWSSPLTQPPTAPTSPRVYNTSSFKDEVGANMYDEANMIVIPIHCWIDEDDDKGECNKYGKGTKKGEKSHINELESNKLVRIKPELECIIEKIVRRLGTERVARGVIVEEVQHGLDLEGDADDKLTYVVPNMEQHDILEHLTYEELTLIAGDAIDADYNNFDDETKARYMRQSRGLVQNARRDVDGIGQRRSSVNN